MITVDVAGEKQRQLAFEDWGEPDGHPVFLLHGTPGSRFSPCPRASVLYRLGLRVIAYDRPGYGDSDPQPGRAVADAAHDVRVIADKLGIKRFGVLGRSGGGPHALACAALLPDRVTRVAVQVSLAPIEDNGVDGFDWYHGMTEYNRREYAFSRPSHSGASPLVRLRTERAADVIRHSPGQMLVDLEEDLRDQDREVIADSGIRGMLLDNYRKALDKSAQGWIDDRHAFCTPWGFELSDIRVPTMIWHGTADVFSPPSHSEWLAGRIPDAELVFMPDAAHFTAITMMPKLMVWAATGRRW